MDWGKQNQRDGNEGWRVLMGLKIMFWVNNQQSEAKSRKIKIRNYLQGQEYRNEWSHTVLRGKQALPQQHLSLYCPTPPAGGQHLYTTATINWYSWVANFPPPFLPEGYPYSVPNFCKTLFQPGAKTEASVPTWTDSWRVTFYFLKDT